MKKLLRYLVRSFLKGLLVVLPIALTAYILYAIILLLEDMLPTENPLIGGAIVLASVTIVGILAGNVAGRRVLRSFEQLIRQVPIIKLFYAAIKDLLSAFIGDRRSFENPVIVDIDPSRNVSVLGFVTCDSFPDAKLKDHVAVYIPQSYNFAGNLLVVHRDRVRPIDAIASEFMAFIMSGGVAQMNAARTISDSTWAGKGFPFRRSNLPPPDPDGRKE